MISDRDHRHRVYTSIATHASGRDVFGKEFSEAYEWCQKHGDVEIRPCKTDALCGRLSRSSIHQASISSIRHVDFPKGKKMRDVVQNVNPVPLGKCADMLAILPMTLEEKDGSRIQIKDSDLPFLDPKSRSKRNPGGTFVLLGATVCENPKAKQTERLDFDTARDQGGVLEIIGDYTILSGTVGKV